MMKDWKRALKKGKALINFNCVKSSINFIIKTYQTLKHITNHYEYSI